MCTHPKLQLAHYDSHQLICVAERRQRSLSPASPQEPRAVLSGDNGHCVSYKLVISSWGGLQTAGDGGELHSQHRACGTSASLHMVAAEPTQDEVLGVGVMAMYPK